jgi:3-hydroxybutyryl-CoA dehydrogenase
MSIKTVGIVGGGLMGAGIATKFALAGHEALVFEASPQRRTTIPAVVEGILQELLAAGVISPAAGAAATARIKLVDGLPALAAASLAIEAIPEVLAMKQELYRELEAVLAPGAVVARNTPPIKTQAH